MLGDPGDGAVTALGDFGSRVGLAFQLFDDILDVSGPPDQTGKGRGTDLLDGTVTLPLILARRADASLNGARPKSTAEAEALCDRIQATDAIEKSREQAVAFVAEAKAQLRELELSDQQRKVLDLVADGVVERYS